VAVKRKRKKVAKEAVSVSNTQWTEYFASIVSVCPWSKAYWAKQKIDVQVWRGTGEIKPLDDYVARMWIHKNASGRTLRNIHNRLNDVRTHEEWLYSHPQYGGHSTPVPVLIQQDLAILNNARQRNKELHKKEK
tara:strand:+ start:207 stop:608 length:402 start_codon:yes stop_codon:yes gene_type:complete